MDPSLLIVWHSRTGAAGAMAHAAKDGAGDGASIRSAEVAGPDDVLAAAGYLFVCPENLATMSGMMKEFFDRCYYPVLGRIEGRAYATIVAAGSDGSGATRQIDRICTGWRLRRACEAMIVNFDAQEPAAILAPKQVQDDALRTCRDLGQALVEGLRMGVF